MKENILITPPTSGGDLQFLGEVNLINYSTFSTQVGVTVGTLTTHRNINKWLHYLVGDTELYVSMVNIRHTISPNQLKSANVVYGSKTTTIGGKTYKVRLLKGIRPDPEGITWDTGYDAEITHGSEWNRLIYPLLPAESASYPQDSQVGEDFANYDQIDLDGNGATTSRSWCQENWNNGTNFVLRGLHSLSYVYGFGPAVALPSYGWRPVLELVA